MDWSSLRRLVLAHHPVCAIFRDDTYRVGRQRLCVGCFTAYPVAAASLLLLWWIRPEVPPMVMVAVGVAAGSFEFLSVAGATTTRAQKVVTKVLLGLGLAIVVWGLATAPWSYGVRVGVLAAGMVGAGVATLPKGIRMMRTCDGCMHRRDWARCPGMGLVRMTPSAEDPS